MNRSLSQLSAAILLLATAVIGCSSADDGKVTLVPTEGKVLAKGAPAAGARVVLYPKDPALQASGMPTPAATTEEDGSFQLMSYEPGDGAPVGEYTVTVTWREEVPEGMSLDTFNPKDRLLGRYASPDKSGLEVTVPEGGGTLPVIDLK
jgi:hypothetical protein